MQNRAEFERAYPHAQLRDNLREEPSLESFVGNALDQYGRPLDWYKFSVDLPPGSIDPFFVEVSKALGWDAVFGGSDSVEIALQLPKAAGGEVNLLYPRRFYEEPGKLAETFDSIAVSAPRYRSREAVSDHRVGTNGEVSADLHFLTQNAEKGQFLLTGFPFIAVPIKGSLVARVFRDGSVRLHFRTLDTFVEFHRKELSLPDAESFPKDFLNATFGDEFGFIKGIIFYNLAVYARSKPQGFRFEPLSYQHIVSWIAKLSRAQRGEIAQELQEKLPRQGVAPDTIGAIRREFGLDEQ